MLWWNVPAPIKIRIFMWLTSKKKILTKDKLIKKGWKGTKCQLCDKIETIDYLFVQGTIAQKEWF